MSNEFVIRNGAQVSSSLSVTGSTNLTGSSDVLNAQASAGGTAPIFNVFGTAGQLFTVTDGLEGSLFSVNTISGLPIMEAFSTGRINLGSYSAPALVVSGSKVSKIDYSGSLILSGSILGTNTSYISIGTTSSVARINAYGTTNVVSVYGSTSEGVMFDVNGPSGQLFSVVDGLSGSLFSVNTISGLPIMEAFSDATIRMGNYGTPALIITGSRVASQTLVVTGSFTVTTGSLIEFQVTNTGTKLGNSPTDTHTVTGSVFISASFSTSSAALSAYKSGSTVLDIQGSQGQLFSVVDSLTGSLMSVNDVSGLPILEVFSNDTVVMGTYGAPALIVTGSSVISKDMTISSSLTINGDNTVPPVIYFNNTNDLYGPVTMSSYFSGLEIQGGSSFIGQEFRVQNLIPKFNKAVAIGYVNPVEFEPPGKLTVQGTGSTNVITGEEAVVVKFISTNNAYQFNMSDNGVVQVTGSLTGQPVTILPESSTASLDCLLGNFFDLTLESSTTTYLSASNIQPGQTINLKITQPSPSGALAYGSEFKFAGGIPYSASAADSVVDIVSFVSFDSSTLYGTALKNLS